MANIQRGLQNRRSEHDLIQDRGVKDFRVSGRVQVIGDGESSVEITFPVTFAERPGFSYGWELADYQRDRLVGGQLPTASIGVARWERDEKVTGIYVYTGAVLTIVTVNNPRYVWVHWHMEGKAYQNPIRDLDEPDELSP